MKIEKFIGFCFCLFIVLFIFGMVSYYMAKETCVEYKEIPIRWEVGGLFGYKIPIETNIENMDEFGYKCERHLEANFFSPFQNILKVQKEMSKANPEVQE